MNLTFIHCEVDGLITIRCSLGSAKITGEIIEVRKGVWGMPRLSKAKKDVVSCEKLRGSANRN